MGASSHFPFEVPLRTGACERQFSVLIWLCLLQGEPRPARHGINTPGRAWAERIQLDSRPPRPQIAMFRSLRARDKEKTVHAVEKTRQTWFGKIAGLFHRGQLDEATWDELEELLISADVGIATSETLLDRLKSRTRNEGVTGPEEALEILKSGMVELLDLDGPEDRLDPKDGPLVLLVVGVNGVGKTTSIAKLAHWYKGKGLTVMLGAADTFRAAAIEQLQAWGSRLEVDVIAHQPNADPGAVTFDTLQAARARGADVVIVDTAGRLHTKLNHMEELKKISRVVSRQASADSQRVLLTLDATTGQNGLAQAHSFVEAVKADGVFLAKLDGTAKGGIVLAIANELKLPVVFVGTGEGPDDIARFDARDFVEGLFSTQ